MHLHEHIIHNDSQSIVGLHQLDSLIGAVGGVDGAEHDEVFTFIVINPTNIFSVDPNETLSIDTLLAIKFSS